MILLQAAAAGAAAASSPHPVTISVSLIAGVITAIGALGTAAFGLVDATKLVRGGVSSSGFIFIRKLIQELAPKDYDLPPDSAISQKCILATLKANWLNGMANDDQKAAAKSLLKMRLGPQTAKDFADATAVDATVLAQVAEALSNGTGLTPAQQNVYGRFDFLLSATIDRAYQRADQRYRNTAKMVAGLVAIALAEIAAYAMFKSSPGFQKWPTFVYAALAGLLATPLAPVAKDLSTTLNNAAKAVQSFKGQS